MHALYILDDAGWLFATSARQIAWCYPFHTLYKTQQYPWNNTIRYHYNHNAYVMDALKNYQGQEALAAIVDLLVWEWDALQVYKVSWWNVPCAEEDWMSLGAWMNKNSTYRHVWMRIHLQPYQGYDTSVRSSCIIIILPLSSTRSLTQRCCSVQVGIGFSVIRPRVRDLLWRIYSR